MNYQEAVDWIHSRLPFGIKPGLKRMEWFMDKLNHPERKLKAIHIAGTNGKGSTLSFLRYLLEAHGFSVGTFTSPYIVKFNERISVNGNPVDDQEIVSLVEKIIPLCEELDKSSLGAPTEFEIITAMAFDYFANANIDYVLFETGLGGRLDSTNIVAPLLTIITNIGLDHTSILGESYKEIAYEKAGIMKQNVPLVTTVDNNEALEVIRDRASILNCSIKELGKDFNLIEKKCKESNECFCFHSNLLSLDDIMITMKGSHQIKNASLALYSFLLFAKDQSIVPKDDAIRKALKSTKWPGRFEMVSTQPLVIIDGAHNEQGVHSLIQTLNKHFPNKKKHLIFSIMKDKDITSIINLLDDYFETIYFTEFEFKRVASSKDLYEKSHHPNKYYGENWHDAFLHVKNVANLNDDLIIFSGSLYFISLIREHFSVGKE